MQTRKSSGTSEKRSSSSLPKKTAAHFAQGGIFAESPAQAQYPLPPPDSNFENDTPKGLSGYDERYIAFVDILGFKDFVLRNHDEVSVSAIVAALDVQPVARPVVLREVEGGEIDVDLRIHTFSDFIVASTLPTHVGLAMLSFVMWELSTRWLSNRFLCRGGITKGKVVHRVESDGGAPMVFGPAFIQAYQLESTMAEMPRIVFSKEVRQDWHRFNAKGSFGRKIPLLVHQCEDGPHCIDTFCHLRKGGFDIVSSEVPVEATQMAEALSHHLDDSAESPAVHKKTRWLADRFNAAVTDTQYAHLKVRSNGKH